MELINGNDAVASSAAAHHNVVGGADRRLEMVPVAQLTPCKRNARTFSRKQIRQIADSIQAFGFVTPVLVDDAGEIIAGHGRVAAAKLLGLVEVPTLRLSHLSPAQKRAYLIADNAIAAKAGWDRQVLAFELQALIDIDFEVSLTGFATGEIEVMLDGADQARQGDAKGKFPRSTSRPSISRAGDQWLLGEHRLVCGNVSDDHAAVDAAIRQWQSSSGKSATLYGSTKTFEAVEQERRRATTPEPRASTAHRDTV
jgi:ParB-like chromosome segregation protein Spo0J